MGDMSKILGGFGKGLAGGMSAIGGDNPMAGAMGGLSGMAGNGGMGGINVMEALFDKLGIFGKKNPSPVDEETPTSLAQKIGYQGSGGRIY